MTCKISDLIAALQEAQAEYGDLPLLVMEYGHGGIESLEEVVGRPILAPLRKEVYYNGSSWLWKHDEEPTHLRLAL